MGEHLTSLFYVIDGGPKRSYPTLEEARVDAQVQIDYCRDNCDPEWPSEVEEIAVYECSKETDEPEEDGICVLQATMTVCEDAEEDDGVEFYCDYELMPPAAIAKTEGSSK